LDFKIGFIGAGKVGTAFGKYLTENGYKIIGYYSKNYTSAQKAANLTDSTAYDKIEDLVFEVNTLFITTPDDVIKEVCDFLVTKKLINKSYIICHMSGGLSSDILKNAKDIGCSVYSLHPMQAFADIESSVKELKNTIFSIEGCEKKIQYLITLINELGNEIFLIDSKTKAIYHAAACVASNYLVTLIDYAVNLLNEIGLEKNLAIKAINPLLMGTVKNIAQMDTEKALTGPIARGDLKTIKKHLHDIDLYCPHNLDFYKFLGKKTVELAKKEKLKDDIKIKQLNKLLGSENTRKYNPYIIGR
jgi:predicted short-subunit dehydrogenase-like oxidoreductase (DUF2520 family)